MDNKIKRKRIKISNYDDFNYALKSEGLSLKALNLKALNLKDDVIKYIDKSFLEDNITYKADNINDFITYIQNLIIFEKLHKKLCNKLIKIEILEISRLEYEMDKKSYDDVGDITNDILKVKSSIKQITSNSEKNKLISLEKEIQENHIYTKDIELLKRILLSESNSYEKYNEQTKVKTIFIQIPSEINTNYVKGIRGSVEYHGNLKNTIARMKRLIKSLDKYIMADEKSYKIDQGKALQDSINIAEAIFNENSFKAVSGSNEIEDYEYIKSPQNPHFKSIKVNRLGKIGTGYNRFNDSEKKILEEIHNQITKGRLNDSGILYLYTKWEPCPSCCYVISQFLSCHPHIKIKVKYINKYGE